MEVFLARMNQGRSSIAFFLDDKGLFTFNVFDLRLKKLVYKSSVCSSNPTQAPVWDKDGNVIYQGNQENLFYLVKENLEISKVELSSNHQHHLISLEKIKSNFIITLKFLENGITKNAIYIFNKNKVKLYKTFTVNSLSTCDIDKEKITRENIKDETTKNKFDHESEVINKNYKHKEKDKLYGVIRENNKLLLKILDLKKSQVNSILLSNDRNLNLNVLDVYNDNVLFEENIGFQQNLYVLEEDRLKKIYKPKGIMEFSKYINSDELVCVYTSEGNPRSIFILQLNEEKMKLIFPNNTHPQKEFESIEAKIPVRDKEKLNCLINFKGKIKKPIIIWLHGGPNAKWDRSFHYLLCDLLAQDMTVIRPNIRGSTDQSKSFASSIMNDWGGIDARDVIDLINFFKKEFKIQENEIYIMGESYGAFLCYILASKYKISCGGFICISGFVDLSYQYLFSNSRRLVKDFLGPLNKNNIFYKVRSPIYYVENIESKLLIIHGKKDTHCPLKQIDFFVEKMRDKNKKFIYWPIEEYGHFYTSSFTIKRLMSEKIIKFINSE
ncbi:alpha/beta hydrolase family protein [Planococcus lenghuensis]|uniref:Peptidase S9 prolyl oligopeptidase catalytic domain-containing protein n=1 Tax=Planococcus lenghuensis TaxID=2213202 RepID=A0A1Q2L5N6_9BACL|nr:alpha/beta fold hydrolase [Planococcus lenghuensis]AQQ55407.1 hypothetical protein B0X71_19765 [Planococcus lenghuensis]